MHARVKQTQWETNGLHGRPVNSSFSLASSVHIGLFLSVLVRSIRLFCLFSFNIWFCFDGFHARFFFLFSCSFGQKNFDSYFRLVAIRKFLNSWVKNAIQSQLELSNSRNSAARRLSFGLALSCGMKARRKSKIASPRKSANEWIFVVGLLCRLWTRSQNQQTKWKNNKQRNDKRKMKKKRKDKRTK